MGVSEYRKINYKPIKAHANVAFSIHNDFLPFTLDGVEYTAEDIAYIADSALDLKNVPEITIMYVINDHVTLSFPHIHVHSHFKRQVEVVYKEKNKKYYPAYLVKFHTSEGHDYFPLPSAELY